MEKAYGQLNIFTGFRDLDKFTSGWRPSELVIIAGRPAMGKTSFMLSMVYNIVSQNIPAVLFSLELHHIQIINRLICMTGNIHYEKIRNGELSCDERTRVKNTITHLRIQPLYIDDTPGISISNLCDKARQLIREHGVRLIAIDYLELMSADTGLNSRKQEIEFITQSLKQLARELNVPILLFVQLNKLVGRDNKELRPRISDLREAGEIEQYSDIVCFIHRPDFYRHRDSGIEGESKFSRIEFIVAKQPDGRNGIIDMTFNKEYARLENLHTEDDMAQIAALNRKEKHD